MAVGVFVLSVMDALAKFAVGHLPTMQIVAIRSGLVLLALIPFVLLTGRAAQLRTRRPVGHVVRGLLSIGAIFCFFESLRTLPLATSIAIGFGAPLMMTAFSVPILKEKVGIHRWTAVAVGFAGVAVIVGPAAFGGVLSAGALYALAAAAFYALGMTCVRWLGSTESEITMIVTQSAVMFLVGLAVLPFVAIPVPGFMWFALAGMGAVLVLGQFLSFRAFRLAPVGAVAPFHYTELLWATALGWIFWGEWPPDNVWYGAAVVVAAGLYVIWRERVRAASGG
jgi:drug/metabolite transporter (DMT)-like permease